MTPEVAERLVLLVLLAGGAALTGISLRHAARVERSAATAERFYPLPLWRFLLLDIVTVGIFGFYWQWRCWRAIRQLDGIRIRPIWRAFFAILWIQPLFRRMNWDANPPVSPALGLVGSSVFIFTTIVGAILDGARVADPLALLLLPAQSAALLPAVVAARRANDPAASVRNRRLSRTAILWMIVMSPMLIVGAFA